MKYAIVTKNDEQSAKVTKQLKEYVTGKESTNPEFVFSVGGDGTFLDAVRLNIDRLDEITFIPIHTGTLGFYTEFLPSEIKKIIDLLNSTEKLLSRKYNMLEVHINGDISYALNEVTFSAHHHLLEGEVYIDDEHLMTMKGNGICISTPSGSTAYNKSLKGAIMDFDVNALQLALIAPFENIHSKMIGPLVFSKKHSITFKPKNEHIDITYDRMFISKSNINIVKVSYSNKYVKCFINPENSYIKRLKEKFIGK